MIHFNDFNSIGPHTLDKFFKKDKREGEYVSYFKNGQIREKATYKNGNLAGKFLAFREDGTHADDDTGEDEDSKRTWEDKDIGNLLHDLSHFDKKQKCLKQNLIILKFERTIIYCDSLFFIIPIKKLLIFNVMINMNNWIFRKHKMIHANFKIIISSVK